VSPLSVSLSLSNVSSSPKARDPDVSPLQFFSFTVSPPPRWTFWSSDSSTGDVYEIPPLLSPDTILAFGFPPAGRRPRRFFLPSLLFLNLSVLCVSPRDPPLKSLNRLTHYVKVLFLDGGHYFRRVFRPRLNPHSLPPHCLPDFIRLCESVFQIVAFPKFAGPSVRCRGFSEVGWTRPHGRPSLFPNGRGPMRNVLKYPFLGPHIRLSSSY